MRQIICPHCKARNRRPKCGSCQTEIPEPRAIEIAWKLYDRRTPLAISFTIIILAFGLWRIWEDMVFAPATYSECRQRASRTARSNAAMYVLLSECSSRFRDRSQ